MAIQISSTEVISNTRVLKNVTIDPSVPINLPSYVVQTTFTGSGTFTKNSNDLFYLIKVWGGGGSGAKTSSFQFGPGSGGGGGGYAELFVLAPEITGPVTVTIGAGGQQADAPAPPFFPPAGTRYGNPGGSSSFGTYLTASGGSGALSQAGEGGQFINPPSNPGNVLSNFSPFLRGNIITGGGGLPSVFGPSGTTWVGSAYWGGGAGGQHSSPNTPAPTDYVNFRRAGYSIYGGAGGGVLNPPSTPPFIPGNDPGPFANGGSSLYGGNGGNYPNGNGSVRGGGGASMEDPATPATQGRGGRGEVQIIAWRN